ncbi:unnamed protein product [Nyctereutes procyonoides]|uniref:(raccoon dog) hypothetical protein n=1 Tax=Nyctereutes procyonoides TaxID=34880 RepID=A0A811YIG2_NYCPR|nr:unnamed protein product [Nyctereutes procyonoides]
MVSAGAGGLRPAASALLLRSPHLPARELSAPARLYHKKVVDHYENPRNMGIQVDEKEKIVDARFKTFVCGSAIASSSLATDWVKGKALCPPSVRNCTALCWPKMQSRLPSLITN